VVNILLVDDDDVTRELVCRGLKRAGADFPITPAEDGREAIEILRGASRTKHIDAPLVVLLDLNMPRMNGFEFLQELRGDMDLRNTPVFILTSSDADTDKERANRGCVAGFMVKSQVGPQYSKLANFLSGYAEAMMQ
jgi:CheY-like chemotaxis protein